jgi:hypothetical protein
MAMRRIVALHLRDERVTRAAKLLLMAHGSLSDWLARRSLPGNTRMTAEEEDGDSSPGAAPGSAATTPAPLLIWKILAAPVRVLCNGSRCASGSSVVGCAGCLEGSASLWVASRVNADRVLT